MKLTRLFQPRNPKFWLLIVLNALSTSLTWIARDWELSRSAATVVAVFAVGNAVFGALLVVDLMKIPPIDKQ
jgi:drug/metabolite transporter (DMT)-like permease